MGGNAELTVLYLAACALISIALDDEPNTHKKSIARCCLGCVRFRDYASKPPTLMAAHMCAFLLPEGREPPYLGHAIRLLVDEMTKQCLAANFLYQLLRYSEQSHVLAKEMLKECLETDEVREIGEIRALNHLRLVK
jgi:hypothetical protein